LYIEHSPDTSLLKTSIPLEGVALDASFAKSTA